MGLRYLTIDMLGNVASFLYYSELFRNNLNIQNLRNTIIVSNNLIPQHAGLLRFWYLSHLQADKVQIHSLPKAWMAHTKNVVECYFYHGILQRNYRKMTIKI